MGNTKKTTKTVLPLQCAHQWLQTLLYPMTIVLCRLRISDSAATDAPLRWWAIFRCDTSCSAWQRCQSLRSSSPIVVSTTRECFETFFFATSKKKKKISSFQFTKFALVYYQCPTKQPKNHYHKKQKTKIKFFWFVAKDKPLWSQWFHFGVSESF